MTALKRGGRHLTCAERRRHAVRGGSAQSRLAGGSCGGQRLEDDGAAAAEDGVSKQ